MGTNSRNHNVWATIFIVLALVLFAFLVTELWTKWIIKGPETLWPLTAGAIVLFLTGLGHGINERWDGVLIDSRFKISLSRLQIILWTTLVLSALITIALPRALLPDGMDKNVEIKFYEQMRQQDEDQETDRAAVCFPNAEEERKEQEEANQAKGEQKPIKVTVADECRDPLAVNLPGELLAALGISIASLAGSVIVKSSKKKKEVDIKALEEKVEAAKAKYDDEEKIAAEKKDDLETLQKRKRKVEAGLERKTGDELNKAQEDVDDFQAEIHRTESEMKETNRALGEAKKAWEAAKEQLKEAKEAKQQGEGLLHQNNSPSEAQWADMFRGEEIGNFQLIDMAKVQMFLITLVVIISYGAAIYNRLFVAANVLKNPLGLDFPAFSAGLIGLLALSHAGYLTVKTADQTRTQSQ